MLLAVESLIISNVVATLLKQGFDRERPSGDGVQNKWGPTYRAEPGQAFPSGHTVTAFSLATVFAKQYRHRRWVPVTAYGLATLVGLSRIHNNRHWPSDVFAGACLGYYTSRMVLQFHEKRSLRIIPLAGSDSAGLHLSISF